MRYKKKDAFGDQMEIISELEQSENDDENEEKDIICQTLPKKK